MQGSAIIAGATGLVGSHLLDQVLRHPDWTTIHTVGRRKTGRSQPKLSEHEIDYRHLDSTSLPAHHDLFCCLGTTLKTAGSPEAFRRVDYEFVMHLARASKERGARQFLLMSSLGADVGSRVLYSRTKGEVERDVARLGFESLVVIRPSLLLGERAESRIGERIMAAIFRPLSFLMVGPLEKYRPIEASTVAAAMIEAARMERRGPNVLESDDLVEIARSARSERAE